jgi:hypothetical protein
MDAETARITERSPQGSEAEVIAFLRGRSVPCPRCAYDLCDNGTARCPECGERLVLKLDSSQVRFGWLVLAMAPGCFSGVAAVFVLIPIAGSVLQGFAPGHGPPGPIVAADAFGFLSGLSVVLMYRHRHRILSWKQARQLAFAATVWAMHVLALGLLILAVWLTQ